MTVCIGAIAAKSQAIVMVADKAVTYSGGAGAAMQHDTGIRKIVPIGQSGWYTLIAGNPTFAIDVVDRATLFLEKQPALVESVRGMLTCMQRAYQVCREKAVIDNVLTPNLLTKALLVARPSTFLPLQAQHTADIVKRVGDYRAGSSLLVCGFDRKKKPRPHIFSVRDPGICSNYDLTGFHAIGIGDETAIARLLTTETDKNDALLKALYGVIDAKVNAEINQGVGYDWDAEILVAGKTKSVRVPKTIMDLIDGLFGSFPNTPFDPFCRAEPKNWNDRLVDYSRKVLPKGDLPKIMYAFQNKR